MAWLAETEEPNSTADTERAARAPRRTGAAPPPGWAWLAAAVQVILESRKGGKCPIPFFECQAAYIAEAWARPPDAALTTQADCEAWVSARLATVAASGREQDLHYTTAEAEQCGGAEPGVRLAILGRRAPAVRPAACHPALPALLTRGRFPPARSALTSVATS